MIDMEMRAWARRNGKAPRTLRRPAAGPGAGDGRAVVLATLRSAPFDAVAAELAVDLALDGVRPLVVVNVVEMPVGRRPHPDLGDPPDVAAALAAPGDRARAAGATVTVLRVRSLRPLAALIGLIGDLAPAAVVFGADPERLSRARPLSRRVHRRAAGVIAARTSCLLWVPDPQPAAATAPPPVRGGRWRPLIGRR